MVTVFIANTVVLFVTLQTLSPFLVFFTLNTESTIGALDPHLLCMRLRIADLFWRCRVVGDEWNQVLLVCCAL